MSNILYLEMETSDGGFRHDSRPWVVFERAATVCTATGRESFYEQTEQHLLLDQMYDATILVAWDLERCLSIFSETSLGDMGVTAMFDMVSMLVRTNKVSPDLQLGEVLRVNFYEYRVIKVVEGAKWNTHSKYADPVYPCQVNVRWLRKLFTKACKEGSIKVPCGGSNAAPLSVSTKSWHNDVVKAYNHITEYKKTARRKNDGSV